VSNTIFFQVGTRDRISLRVFVDSLGKFLGILRDLDSVLSDRRGGSVDWEVTSLKKSSPAEVGVTPITKPIAIRLGKPEISEAIEHQFLDNTRSLNEAGERNKFMPDAALLKLKALASKTKRIGPMSIIKKAYVDQRIAEKAVELARDFGLKPADSVHAATAILAEIPTLQRWDKDYDKVAHLIEIEDPKMISKQPDLVDMPLLKIRSEQESGRGGDLTGFSTTAASR